MFLSGSVEWMIIALISNVNVDINVSGGGLLHSLHLSSPRTPFTIIFFAGNENL